MAERYWDALIIADPRFMGGTSAAIATDVRAFHAMGLRIGLHFVSAQGFFQEHETANPVYDDLLALSSVDMVNANDIAHARIAFFHHPSVFLNPLASSLQIRSEKAVIITHQPLFSGDGALNIDPLMVQRNIYRSFGVKPLWAPISGLCRRQYLSFAPFLKLTSIDWFNTFAVEDWTPTRDKLTSPHLIIGRHGRPHADKWPDTGADISASLPVSTKTNVRVMGADQDFFTGYGADTSGWDILAFNAEPVADFLDSLDVFSYFHSARWTEAFGRTVAEAMLMENRCILDPALEPTFGPHALYCAPHEVTSVLDHIRGDLAGARRAASAARKYFLTQYSTQTVAGRYIALLTDTDTPSDNARASVSPLMAARRFVGFHRRRYAAKHG